MANTNPRTNRITTTADDNPPGTMLSRGLDSLGDTWFGGLVSSAAKTTVDGFGQGLGAVAGGGAYLINGAPTLLGYEPTFGEDFSAKSTFDIVHNSVTQAGADMAKNVYLVADGQVGEVARRTRDGAIALGDGALDGATSVVGLAAAGIDATINYTPTIFGAGPTFGEDHRSWGTFEAVDGFDDTVLGSIYSATGYELRTDGSYGVLHFGGEMVGIPGAGAIINGTARTVKAAVIGERVVNAATDVGRAAESAAPAFKAASHAPENMTVKGVEQTAEAGAKAATEGAETVAEAGAKAATEGAETVAETGAEAAARPGNMVTRTAASVVSKNSPRGIFRSTDSAADKLMRLSRAEDTVAANKYTTRLINDIGAGRPGATISETELSALRTSGRFSKETMDALTAAKDASRSFFGRTGHKLSHLGDTFRANASIPGTLSLAKDVTLAPLTAARWAISYPFSKTGALKLGTVWGAAAADGYLFDHKIQDTPGDAYGALYRGVGNVADAVGVPFVGDAADVAAAAVDPDQTVAGTLQDQGHVLAATAAGVAAPVVALAMPGDQTGQHAPVEAPAAGPTGTGPAAPAAAPDGSQPNNDTDGYMQNLMQQLANSPVGQFLDQMGPWGQMIAFGLAAALTGRLALMMTGQGGSQLLATLAVVGAVIAAPTLANAFHDATNNSGPKPSEVAANTFGNIDTGRLAHDGKEFVTMATGHTFG